MKDVSPVTVELDHILLKISDLLLHCLIPSTVCLFEIIQADGTCFSWRINWRIEFASVALNENLQLFLFGFGDHRDLFSDRDVRNMTHYIWDALIFDVVIDAGTHIFKEYNNTTPINWSSYFTYLVLFELLYNQILVCNPGLSQSHYHHFNHCPLVLVLKHFFYLFSIMHSFQ